METILAWDSKSTYDERTGDTMHLRAKNGSPESRPMVYPLIFAGSFGGIARGAWIIGAEGVK
jgi:hypothetical protein